MPRYLVESYAPDGAVAQARARAREASKLEPGVRYLRSTYMPTDEFLVHVFEAPSAEALDRAGRRAELEYERIIEAVESTAEEGRSK